ncbi:MAG: FAD-dependent oxidoreductase [Candidatus Liptonbacteria bacterium]|nr:FAD-dependent oxidoreductase [Candidatus Liptonbacteria bacterium]
MHIVKLSKREEIADGTVSFYFEKPAGFSHKAGQFLDITLINPPETDDEGNIRPFSMASAPHEPEIMIATRIRDTAFKRVLKSAPLGTEIQIEGPFGSFTLHNDSSRPAVFLIGGIGITPIRSIVLDVTNRKLPHKLFLFYSNRQQKDAAFFKELEELESKNDNYKFISTMTDIPAGEDLLTGSPSQVSGVEIWEGERGYINAEMLKKHLGGLVGPIYYSAGPQAMVAAMRKTLNDAGVDDDYIRTEEFSGY